MNEQVDNQIVSLQFDNKNFEKNTKTSMKTLDKLKAKLNFKGAAKGLQDIEDASKKVRFETLANSIDTVKNKFSALEVMGITALANLTNSAVNYGKRIVSAPTIDPVNTGFSEYETKMGSIQTILANTSSKGKKLEDVTKVLNELNTYADKTIYNFAEMTRNIGTFTAAGVDLEVAASAIQGIANIAAVSGSTSQQASVAMYQLSQAISSGTVRLQDWNSVVNAGMGGEKFQNALIATAREMARTTSTYAYNVDELLIKNGSFRESLREGWLTADVLNQTLKKFTVEGAKEYGQKMMDLGEWTQETADSLVAMAQEMEDAATKVKTFSQLWDTLKEAAQSGWAQTWEIIIGDFDQAKTFLTYISDTVSGMIGRSADKRNTFLGIALNPVSTFNSLIQNAGLNLNYFQEKIKETAKKNEIAIDSLIKEHGSLSNVISEGILPTNIFVEALESLTEEELRSAGYTKDQIEAIQQLGEEAKKTGTSLNNTIIAMGQKSGWSLMFDSIKKIVNYIGEALSHVKKAWSDTFSPMQSSALYSFVKRINDFASGLSITDETANKLYRTGKGIAALFDIIFSTVKGGWRLMSRFVSEILGVADVDLLELTARIGDLIVKFRDWLKSVINLNTIFDKLSPIIKRLGQFIKQAGSIIAKFLDTLRNSNNIPRDIILGLVNGLKDGIPLIVRSVIDLGKTILLTLKDVLGIRSPSKEAFEIMKWFFLGMVKGIKEFGKWVWDLLKNFGTRMKEIFASIGDTASIVLDKLKPIASSLYNLLKTTIDKVTSLVSELNLNKVLSIGLTGGSLAILYKVAKGILAFGKAAENVSEPLRNLKGVFTSIDQGISRLTKALSTKIQVKAVKDLAIAIAILAGAIAALALIPNPERIDSALGTIIILVGAVAGLSVIAGKLAELEAVYGKNSTLKSSGAIFGIGATLLVLAGTFAKLASVDPANVEQAKILLFEMVGAIAALAVLMMFLTQFTSIDKEIHKLGLTLMGVSTALLIFAKALSAAAKVSQIANLADALGIIIFMTIMLGGMVAVSQLYSYYSKGMSKMLFGFTANLVLMLGVVKIAGSMKVRELLKGISTVQALVVLMGFLVGASNIYNKEASGIGKAMLGIGAALLSMVISVKIISGLDDNAIAKGFVTIVAFSALVVGLIAATRLAGDKELKRMMSTITGMGICIGMLAASVFALQFLEVSNIAKGTAAVVALSAMMALMVKATKGSGNPSKSIYALAVSIGVLVAAVIGLSYIPTEDLFKSVGALSIILASFALVIKSAGSLKKNKIVGQLLILGAIAVVLGGIVVGLSALNVKPAIEAIASMVILLTSMANAMWILSKMKDAIKPGTKVTLTVMAGLVAGLYAVIKTVMYFLPNIEPTIEAMAGISLLLIAMSDAMWVLSNMKDAIKPGTKVALTVMAAIVAGLYAALRAFSNIKGSDLKIETAVALGVMINALCGAVLILAKFPKGSFLNALSAIGILIILIGALALLVGGLGELGKKLFGNDLEATLDAGVMVFTKIGEAVGGLVAGGFKAVADVVIETLYSLAGCLEDFIAALNTINPESMEGFKTIAESVLILTAADVLDGIDLFKKEKFARLGEAFKSLAEPIVEFANTISSKTSKEALDAARNAADTIAVLSLAIPRSGGWVDKIFGSNDLDKFGEQIKSFGTAIVNFSATVAGNIDKNAIDAAKSAGEIMIELQKKIPETGGLIDMICGYSDLATFGRNIKSFGESMVGFSNTVAGNTEAGKLDKAAVENAKAAGEIMIELQKSVPNTGGFIGWLNGQQGLDDFGRNIKKYGEGIVAFATSISETAIDLNKVQQAADAGGIMVTMLNDFPLTNSNALGMLGTALDSIATSLTNFNKKIQNIDADKTDKASKSIKAMVASVVALDNINPDNLKFSAVEDIIKSTIETLLKSADEISRAINEGMEIKPVVKPVLDLSNVRQGASLIPSMLNTQPALGTLSNIGYISANMNRNSQNGNSDVVAAIDKLRESLGDIGNDTYNINGITYNDDSAIADAIKTIIRAINIERRS